MATRTGSAVWEGTLKEGRGTMKLGSGAFDGPYSFSSRFEEAKGTNPEELIGAAEAGCFSMALSANLEKAGHPAKRIIWFTAPRPIITFPSAGLSTILASVGGDDHSAGSNCFTSYMK